MLKAFLLALAGMLVLGLTTLTEEPGLLQLMHIGGLCLMGIASIMIITIDKNKNKRL